MTAGPLESVQPTGGGGAVSGIHGSMMPDKGVRGTTKGPTKLSAGSQGTDLLFPTGAAAAGTFSSRDAPVFSFGAAQICAKDRGHSVGARGHHRWTS